MGSAGASQRGDWECERTLTGHNGGVVGVCFIQGVPPPRAPRRPAAPPPSRCASCTPRDTAFTARLLHSTDAAAHGRTSRASGRTSARPPPDLRLCAGNLISASNDSFIKVWNTSGVQRPFTAK